jgi:hypothetical protein
MGSPIDTTSKDIDLTDPKSIGTAGLGFAAGAALTPIPGDEAAILLITGAAVGASWLYNKMTTAGIDDNNPYNEPSDEDLSGLVPVDENQILGDGWSEDDYNIENGDIEEGYINPPSDFQHQATEAWKSGSSAQKQKIEEYLQDLANNPNQDVTLRANARRLLQNLRD